MTKTSLFRPIAFVAALFTGFQFTVPNVSHAAPVTENFAFRAADKSLIASGFFTYDTSSPAVLSFDNLSAFQFTYTALGASFDLPFIKSLSVMNGDYVYFGYDTASNTFVPQIIDGYAGQLSALIAGTDGVSGFFADPLPGTAQMADGAVTIYSVNVPDGAISATAATYDISAPVAAIPEPSTWALMIVGFFGLGVFAIRKQRLEMQKVCLA